MYSIIKKLANTFEFFKSTLAINLSVSTVALLFGGIEYFAFIFMSFGFVLSLVIKELNYKNDYLFYFNNGISKIRLLLFTYLISIVFTVLAYFVLLLLIELF